MTSQLDDVEVVRELIESSDAHPIGAAEAVQAGFAASVAVALGLSTLGLWAAIGLRRSLSSARLSKRAA